MNDSLTEMPVVSEQVKARGLTRCFVYRGPSMLPTFRNGQLLYVRPFIQSLGVGDVIVFEVASGERYIVHRIISTRDGIMTTRGDNNRQDDPLPVRIDQVIGKVEEVEGGEYFKRVLGGRKGLISMKIRWVVLQTGNFLYTLIKRPYTTLLDRQFVIRFWHPSITKVTLQTGDGPVVKYLHNHRVVAVWYPLQQHFSCRKPYDFVIPVPDKEKE